MERFQNVVRFSMHGHTHTAYYEVTQSYSNPGTPIMFSNVAGSVTTYTNENPSYMIIDFD
jgi:predicted phosphodiesterase